MTRIKLCGLSRPCDIEAANELKPEYIGFVFAQKSRRFVTTEKAKELKNLLNPEIKAVGVFVNESVQTVAELLNNNTIDLAQLHGDESEEYIHSLRKLTDKQIIKAFSVKSELDITAANASSADFVLLDSAVGGSGTQFDWNLLKNINRDYFLAGGINADNVSIAKDLLGPYAVDISSGIETDGFKDKAKTEAFVAAVRKENII